MANGNFQDDMQAGKRFVIALPHFTGMRYWAEHGGTADRDAAKRLTEVEADRIVEIVKSYTPSILAYRMPL